MSSQPISKWGAIPIPGPLSIGDIIDRAFRIYRARFKPMLLTALALLVPLGVLSGILSYFINRPLFEETGTSLDAMGLLGSTFGSLALSLLAILIQGLAELALTFHARAALADEALEPGQAVSSAFGRIGSWLGMSILRALAYVGVVAVAVVPSILLAALAGSGDSSSAAAAVGLLCLFTIVGLGVFILAVILYVRWIVATPALVVEELGARGSLGRSWGLTKGKFWRSFGVTLVLVLISLVVLSLPNVVITLLTMAATERTVVWSAVSTALGTVLSALYVPLSAATYLVLYYDLRVRRENLDLDLRVQQLEAETSPSTPEMEGPQA